MADKKYKLWPRWPFKKGSLRGSNSMFDLTTESSDDPPPVPPRIDKPGNRHSIAAPISRARQHFKKDKKKQKITKEDIHSPSLPESNLKPRIPPKPRRFSVSAMASNSFTDSLEKNAGTSIETSSPTRKVPKALERKLPYNKAGKRNPFPIDQGFIIDRITEENEDMYGSAPCLATSSFQDMASGSRGDDNGKERNSKDKYGYLEPITKESLPVPSQRAINRSVSENSAEIMKKKISKNAEIDNTKWNSIVNELVKTQNNQDQQVNLDGLDEYDEYDHKYEIIEEGGNCNEIISLEEKGISNNSSISKKIASDIADICTTKNAIRKNNSSKRRNLSQNLEQKKVNWAQADDLKKEVNSKSTKPDLEIKVNESISSSSEECFTSDVEEIIVRNKKATINKNKTPTLKNPSSHSIHSASKTEIPETLKESKVNLIKQDNLKGKNERHQFDKSMDKEIIGLMPINQEKNDDLTDQTCIENLEYQQKMLLNKIASLNNKIVELKTDCQNKSRDIKQEYQNEKIMLQCQFDEKKRKLQEQFDEDVSKLQEEFEKEIYMADEKASRAINKLDRNLTVESRRIEDEVEKFKLFLIPDLDGQESSTKIDNSSLNIESEDEDVNKEFECPVCLEFMAPPKQIIQCSQGHLVCSGCTKNSKVQNCPTCRGDLAGRNKPLERVAKALFYKSKQEFLC